MQLGEWIIAVIPGVTVALVTVAIIYLWRRPLAVAVGLFALFFVFDCQLELMEEPGRAYRLEELKSEFYPEHRDAMNAGKEIVLSWNRQKGLDIRLCLVGAFSVVMGASLISFVRARRGT